MRIRCPYCGERDMAEFFAMGAALPARPAADAGAAVWHDHIFLRDNPLGESVEWWQHQHGCRAWLVLTRDTRTHAILGVRSARPLP
jgi:sarcosine oxidase subunit delta